MTDVKFFEKYYKGEDIICDRNNKNNQGNGYGNHKDSGYLEHGNSDHEHRNYGHINERVEETDSTQNPPKERR